MCGIAGFIDSQLGENARHELAGKMLTATHHRGPDATNVHTEGPVVLGHNRLKIIDLSNAANQPFLFDDTIIIFNGEIYNYIEVRAELEKKGFQFRTHSDTEVICAAYKHWGEDCVLQFMGMWSFAIWDKKEQKLFCSRDRFGIKPFYYFTRGEHLYFASEYKALKELPFFNRDLNTEHINRSLQISLVTYKEETFYTHLKALEPAHNLVWKNGKVTTKIYWDIDVNQPVSNLSWQEKKEKFFALFKESVALHSRSDVKNGTCLSGGLDSSAISSMYSTLMPDAPIKSFSIYYESDVDERPYVHEVVKKYPNIQPFYFSPSNQQIADSFHRAAYHADVPLLGSAYISQYFLMQLAKSEGVTVALDGQGADEYLGGYLHSFYRIIGQQFSSFSVPKAFGLLSALAEREKFSSKTKNDFLLKSLAVAFNNEEKIYNLDYGRVKKYLKNNPKKIQLDDATSNKFNNFLYHLLMDTTLQTILHFEDRNSMAFSIESRVPFLDHRLVDFCFSLTREDRVNDKAETKYILREALKDILPEKVYARKDKKGFVTPGEIQWLNGPLKFLLDIDYSQLDWMNTSELKTIVEQYKKGDVSNAKMVWKIGSINYWLKNFN